MSYSVSLRLLLDAQILCVLRLLKTNRWCNAQSVACYPRACLGISSKWAMMEIFACFQHSGTLAKHVIELGAQSARTKTCFIDILVELVDVYIDVKSWDGGMDHHLLL